MLRLATHIERLLWVHDCVIVPNLGGFVLQSKAAVYVEGEHIFRPVRKEILFNTTLTYQDGLLSESYMKTYHVSFRKANEMVAQDVEALRCRLFENKQLDLGALGSLSVGEEGQLVFSAVEDPFLDVEAYGLPSFYFKPLVLLRSEQRDLLVPAKELSGKKKENAIYIRINRGALRAGAAVAAVAALIFLVSTPVKDVNHSMYTASFVPEITLVKKNTKPESSELKEADTTRLSLETTDKPAPSSSSDVQAIVQKNKKLYYVVIGSFPNEELSEKYIRQIDRNLSPNVGYVRKGDNVRVYSDKFDNREDAEAYMYRLRQTEKHSDAWLFISR